MPAITTYDAKQGLEIGGAPSVQVDTSAARASAAQGAALAGLGQDVQRVADHWQMREDQMAQTKARLTTQAGQQAIDTEDIEAANKMPASGEGWVESRLKAFDDRRKESVALIPEGPLRQEFEERWDGLRGSYKNKYVREQVDQRTSWSKTNTAEKAQSSAEAVLQDPGQFDARKKDFEDWLKVQPLPEADKLKLKQDADLLLAQSKMRGWGERDPYGTRQGLGVPFVSPRARQTLSAILARDKQPEQHIDKMEPQFAEGLANMVTAAPPEIAKGLGIMSGARTSERQQELWDASDKTGRTVGSPDGSKHVHGQAADLTFNGKRLDDPSVPQGVRDWVKDNAGDYGLALPLDGKEGRSNEPWHIEDLAARGKLASGGRSRAEGALFRGQSIASYVQQTANLSPVAAAAMGGHAIVENGGRSTGQPGDNGSAFGTFQWRGDRLEGLKKFAGDKGGDWRDQKTQLDYALWEMDNGDAGARRAGRELRSATTVEDAVKAWMHFERPQGYDPNRPEAGHAYERRLQEAKAILGQKGGGGDLERSQGTAPGAGSPLQPAPQLDGAPVDPRFADVPFSARMAYANQLDGRIMQMSVEKRADLDITNDNAPAAIRATGGYTGAMPSEADYIEAHGPVEGPRRYDAFTANVQTARDEFGMRAQTSDEIRRVVESAQPSSSGDEAVVQSQRYRALAQAADATLKARAADPAEYVMTSMPALQDAWKNAQPGTPAYASAIRMTMEAQRSIGIPDGAIRPLPGDMARSIGMAAKDEARSSTDRISGVVHAVFATPDKAQQQAVFAQLVKEGAPETLAGAMNAYARGDKAAAQRLAVAALVDPAKLPGAIDSKPKDIDAQIQSDIMAEGEIGDVAYGLSNGVADNEQSAIRDATLMRRAVQLRLRDGERLSTAVAGVSRDLFGDVKVYRGGNGVAAEIIVPTAADGRNLSANLSASIDKVFRPALEARLDGSATALDGDAAKSVAKGIGRRSITDLLDRSSFRSINGGVGLVSEQTGTFVAGADGKPIVLSLDDLMKPSGAPLGGRFKGFNRSGAN